MVQNILYLQNTRCWLHVLKNEDLAPQPTAGIDFYKRLTCSFAYGKVQYLYFCVIFAALLTIRTILMVSLLQSYYIPKDTKPQYQ